ncbi:MAG: SIS domain-containing protein [Bacteroidales bacterium]|nr:SIS domain-containing protein [Bacteroidales bacterium]
MNKKLLDQFCTKHPELAGLRDPIRQAAEMIIKSYTGGGKLLVCGNGGSSSDSDHLVCELMKSFESERPLDKSLKNRLNEIAGARGKFLAEKLEHGLPAISLSAHTALITAISNDKDANLVFAQQIIGFGDENDILIGISTSGNSQNVIDACITAKALNLKVIGFTGKTGGKMKQYCDVLVNVPESRTAFIQELQLPIFHILCLIVENHFYGHKN